MPTLYRKESNLLQEKLMKDYRWIMELQNEVKYYLSRFGITKSHMAKALNISLQQLSAWTNQKLVLPKYHIENIELYVDTLKRIDAFLQDNGLVM